MSSPLSRLIVPLLLSVGTRLACADPAPFDLAGPQLSVTVTRGGDTLPISEVPNLAVGDQLAIRADLPASQSARYLMVIAFLRGATNPPPPSWFFRCDTWLPDCERRGLTVTVPKDAQQVLVFLAPSTGGDYKTLLGAVRGRPGAFVRTSQDLDQATLDRSRLDAYLAAVRALADGDQTQLKQAAPLLARSLAIKVDDKCLDKIPELQAPCLMQGQDALILNDGHSTSIVEALTSAPATDLAMEASYTPQLSYGYYSPYIASVLDIARILGSFHSARYQYIPALASYQDNGMALTLNTAPSFHDPQSVLVAALPAVERSQPPPLHAVDPRDIYCARRTALVLPVEGAPLVFSTRYAHGMSLRLVGQGGHSVDLPARADARQGGFVIDTSALGEGQLGDSVHGELRGQWGFEAYQGPSFQLLNARSQHWQLASSDEASLIVGRESTVHLQAASVSCIDSVMLKDPGGKELKAEWKTVRADELEVKLPLQAAQPGELTLLVNQYGAAAPVPVSLHAFSEAGHLESFTLHAGDAQGVLVGSRLDEVASMSVDGIAFTPGKLSTSPAGDELAMLTQDAAAATLTAGASIKAHVTLKDGRVLELRATVRDPRPAVALIGKDVELAGNGDASHIRLAAADELPQDGKLTFSVRAQTPASFAHDESVEVATGDESAAAHLTLDNGGLTLVNATVAVARLDPGKSLGASAFGPLRFRVIAGGVAGDWQPLATLVRLPVLQALRCPVTVDLACKLSGTNLFLIDSLATDAQFHHPVQVPDGFPGDALPVPHSDGELYLKLRDDPAVTNIAALQAEQLPPTAEELARELARHAAAAPMANTPAAGVPAPEAPALPHEGTPAGAAAAAPGTPAAPAAAAPAPSASLPPHAG
jgi:hypothetical protein